MEKVKSSKKFVCEILCFVFGIVLSLVGLYFYHQQYLCYEYTPLLFILGVVVCLGGSLLSLSLSITKNETKNAKIKKHKKRIYKKDHLNDGLFVIRTMI